MLQVFLISSLESMYVAENIKTTLEEKAALSGLDLEVVTWYQHFRASDNNDYTWNIFSAACDKYNYAISILRADDSVEQRGKREYISRDNVILETGAFAMKIGLKNVFLLVDKDEDYHLASDFMGVCTIKYDYGYGKENSSAYEKIINQIKRCENKKTKISDLTLENNFKGRVEDLNTIYVGGKRL